MKSWQALTLSGIAIILVLAPGCGSFTPPPKLVISAITLPAGLVGNTYNASFAATGGITPYTWTLYSGSLPVGMNLGSSGSLAGTPTTAGQFTFTVQVADAETPRATATQQVMLTINPAPPALYVSQTSLPEGVVNTAYSTTIQVAGGLPPYSFSLTQGSLPPGLTLSGTGVVSGTPTQAGASSFTVQVSDAESPPQTTSSPIYITIVATPLTISTTTLPDAVVNVPYYQQLQVTGGVPPYTWQEQNLGQGFFLIDGAVTTSPFGFVEWPKQVGTASFTVKVMDSAQQVASQSLSVTIDLGGNVLLNGSYLFMASGFGPGGTSQWAVAGSLVADGNGNITSGELDMNSTASAPQNSAITGTYSVAPNGLGTMTLNGTSSSVTFAFALSSSFNLLVGNTIATGQIIEFDDASGQGSRAAGVIMPQGTSFLLVRYLSGFYVFGYSGQDVATSGRLAEVGEFGFDPSGAFYKGGIADSNDAGTVNSLTLDGSLAEFDGAGRSLATITVTGGGPPRVEHYALYAGRKVDNSAEMYAVSIDPLNGSGQLLSGPVLNQTPSSGNDDDTFLNGILALQAVGLDVSGGQSKGMAAAGLATFDGAGNITKLDVEQNVGGSFNIYNGVGTYSVANNSRITLAAQGLPSIGYRVTPNQMFAISTDASATLAYFLQQQPGAPFSNASLSGYYSAGSLPPVEANVTNSVLQLTADGKGNLTGVGDNSGPNGLQSNMNFAATYSLDATGKSPLSGSLSGYLYLGGFDQNFGLPEFIVVTGESNPRVLTILGY